MARDEQHWLLNDADAAKYGGAVANVVRWLPVNVSQKALDFSALAMMAFTIESARVGRSWQLAKNKGQPRRPAQVFQFHSPTSVPSGPLPPQKNQEPVEGFVQDGIDAPVGGL